MKLSPATLTGLSLLGIAFTASAQSVGIGPNNYTPNTNAALDISSGTTGNKGLLVPRITAAQRGNFTSSAEGMLVYQTDGTQPGFWYYTGGTWVPLPSGVASSAGWLTTGNAGTAPGTFTGVGANTNGTGGTSFVGTTDQQDLVFRTGNTERLRITTDGSLYSRSTYGLILSAADAPLITRGWDTFSSGAYNGLGRWGLFMRASTLTSGIPDDVGSSFSWVTWRNTSAVNTELMRLSNNGNLGIGLAGGTASARLSLVGTGTANPNTANATQSAGHLARFRDNGNVTLDLGSSGTGGTWLQSTNPTDLSTNYALRLNPNGGNVGIGTGTAAPGSTLSVGGTMSVAVSTAIAGGASGSGTLLGTYNAIYLGLSPADGTNNNYLLPDPTTCPGRIYYVRNNSSSQQANLGTVGYAAGTRQLYNGNGSGGFQTYGLSANANGKTIMCISDGANWTIGQVN